jgi:hypothetical protein
VCDLRRHVALLDPDHQIQRQLKRTAIFFIIFITLKFFLPSTNTSFQFPFYFPLFFPPFPSVSNFLLPSFRSTPLLLSLSILSSSLFYIHIV